ncbi:hypothetical protein LCI18_004166 [Fusarium solani-melongenae]|uniref:Uncharacterized protein n=1 Tax=Fusarium solani subsp. cucurbitae TaxID=2747967 RepID=A0ACD3YX88_FUSSC|nr:hypothetical protein LCI18_004166 [Fusarium solani-melongenae]
MSAYSNSWLEFENALGGIRPVLRGTAPEMRAQYSGLVDLLSPQHPSTRDTVQVTDGQHGAIAYRIYKPVEAEATVAPVGVFYHSGGLVVGNLDSEDAFCRQVALRCHVIIVSVDYRLSPEHKAPAHVEDALSILEWTYSNAQAIGGDSSQIFVIGSSAGGQLDLAVTRMVALGQSALPVSSVKGVVALCPVVLHPLDVPEKYVAGYSSYEEHAENSPVIDKTTMLQMFANTGVSPIDEQYFPVRDDGCLSLFPPTYIATCGQDPLRDDGAVLHRALSSASVPIRTQNYKSLPHCFWIVPSLPETSVFLNDLTSGVAWVLES